MSVIRSATSMYQGFPRELVAALRCPVDAASLKCNSEEMHLRDASLVCNVCKGTTMIRNGIVMLLEQAALPEHVLREMSARDEGAASYDAHLSDRFYREMVPTIREIGPLKEKTVIEHGAGTGRFSALLSKESGMYMASDISLESLYILSRKAIPANLGLVCADATTLRVAEDFFDVALALQVIEHMPTLGIREQFYTAVRKSLKRGGKLIASVYHQDLRRIRGGEPKDGIHGNGIPFHFFTISEFRSEIEKYFTSAHARAIDITLPFERRLHLPARVEGMISRVCEHMPFLNRYGHLVLAKGNV